MKKRIKYFAIFMSIFCCSCNNSDDILELSGNYFLRKEGENINDILPHGKSKNEIHANVIRVGYSDEFIIAEQKPNEMDDPLYQKVYEYSNGRDQLYYWIIVINEDLLLGPLSKSEFEVEKNKHHVPKNLILEKFN